MRIGVYGSSFDPLTYVHLWTANSILQHKHLDKVIMVPANTKRQDKSLHASNDQRWEMLSLAVANNPKLEPSRVELDQTHRDLLYSYKTMEYLQQENPGAELFFIAGADILAELPNWTLGKQLIEAYRFIIVSRDGYDMGKILSGHPLLRAYDDHFSLVYKGFANEVSSSYVREEFAYGGDPRYLIPDVVYDYIQQHNIYQRGVLNHG